MPTSASSKSPGTARHLIESLTGSDALPVFVRRIDPHTLKTLVDEVGLEDSGALIAHASNRQLIHLLDETIWTGARPGDPDTLSVEELLRWLDLWNGLGQGFVADKLYELGDDFCALAFSRLLIVADYDMAPRVMDEHTQVIGRYLIRVRIDDEWDAVQTSVVALWNDYPDFAEAVFARLSFRHSILKMFGEDDLAQVINADASHAHEQGREEAGYVTSIMAGSFLRDLVGMDIDVLMAEREYDLQTQEYFRRRRQLQAHAREAARKAQVAGAEADARLESEQGGQSAERSGPADREQHRGNTAGPAADDNTTDDDTAGDNERADPEQLASLALELAAYERAQQRGTALLTGPETADLQESDWIRVALGRLQTTERFDACLDELTYLANLLIAGTDLAGDRLESGLAANLVVATCNLGASHELWLAEVDAPVDAVVAMMEQEPGLVRLFRIGWHLLTNLPIEAAERLVALFTDEAVRGRLAEKPWVLSEVDALLSSPEFVATVRARKFEDARETLKILGIALEPEAVVVLCVLTDGVPRFARLLEGKPPEGAVMTYASRDFTTMGDLLALHRFLDRLEDQVRL